MSQPYAVPETLPLNSFESGTNLLVMGPDRQAREFLAISLILAASDYEESMIFITPNVGARKLLQRCERIRNDFNRSYCSVIDCTGAPGNDIDDEVHIERVSGTGDLTGIGIRFSGLYDRSNDAGIGRVRTGFLSLSTLLMYRELPTVFRFLQTLSGRSASVDGLGVFMLDPTATDERTVNTITQLFDGALSVRELDAGTEYELRARNLPGQPRGWQSFSLGGL